MTSIYQFEAELLDGKSKQLADYEGKVLLIVNTASKCGFTPQFSGLEKLYEKYKDQGLEVLGFPCNQFGGQEPGTNEEIQQFCSLKYQVTFPVMAKVDVNGDTADPLYKHLKQAAPGDAGGEIEWNFAKFLVDADGGVVKRYDPKAQPESIAPDIQALLKDAG